MKYAKIITESAISTNPPQAATIGGQTYMGQLPESYLATLGYYPLTETSQPSETPDQGKHWEARYALIDNHVIQSWIQVQNAPDPMRSLSKRKLYRALIQFGIWDDVKAYIENAGVWEDWEYATTLDEDDPLIQAAILALQNDMGISQEQVEELLEAAAIDE